MKVDESTINKILDFVDQIPVYMIGSNASLPLIGGSILNHEHYQGGRHLMPMHRAGIKENYQVGKVKVSIVDWYNSAIRLESNDRNEISAFAKKIVCAWKDYSDEENFIFAQTDGVPHNSCSPIARKDGENYIIDIILRNNITTEEYPEGVFHAHPEYHNIKHEGIGLIEAMGLFILPGRLKKELEDIEFILQGAIHSELHEEDNPLNKHRKMIRELADGGMALSPEEAKQRVNDKVGEICKNILINTAVFKEDEKGILGFRKFLNSIGVK
jgi:UDPglucose--hexose-1-phosphate uridylyltransferase